MHVKALKVNDEYYAQQRVNSKKIIDEYNFSEIYWNSYSWEYNIVGFGGNFNAVIIKSHIAGGTFNKTFINFYQIWEDLHYVGKISEENFNEIRGMNILQIHEYALKNNFIKLYESYELGDY